MKGRKKNRDFLKFETNHLRRFIQSYCDAYDVKISHFSDWLKKMGITLPTTLERFDGKSTFYTSSGEEITLCDDIEDYFPIIMAKKENVTKQFQCFIHAHSTAVELRYITIGTENFKAEVCLMSNIYQIKMPDGEFHVAATPEVREYLNKLDYSIEPQQMLQEILKISA